MTTTLESARLLSRPGPRRALVLVVALIASVAGLSIPAQHAAIAATCPCSIWTSTATPVHPSDSDRSAVEVGVKFRSDSAGTITGIRFYKGAGNTGTHVGNLWDRAGTRLASATFTGETATGWQTVTFPSPVTIAPNTTYVASYYAPAGGYAGDNSGLSSGVDSAPLHALADGVDGGNGVYRYGTGGGFPTNTYLASNYWVDVIFTPSTGTGPPTVIAQSPTASSTGVAPTAAVTATFDQPVTPASIVFTLSDSSGTAVAGATSYDGPTNTARLTPSAALAAATTYTATVRGATSASGTPMSGPVSWSFVTGGSTTACPCTIWPASTTPAVAAENDPNALEVGIKFQSAAAGFVTGVRFYKGTGNTGTHIGHLWTAAGALLSSATFTGESASGWQSVTFPAPIPVAANTTYVASYFAPSGRYAGDTSYFTGRSVVNGPLTALADGAQGGNGVYRYGASAFPTQTFLASNYWVDVVFVTNATDTTPPTVVARNPASGSTAAPLATTISATFSEPVVAGSATLTLSGNAGPVAGSQTYDAGSQTLTFTPSSALAATTGYAATVSGARDPAGNTMQADTWSFTTGAAPPPPPDTGSGGPILVLTSTGNPYSSFTAEILRSEGLTEFATADVGTLSAPALVGYNTVLLGATSLTAAQAGVLNTWVTNGGNLIAFRPDAQLASLLGITIAGTPLSEGYLKVVTTAGPGTGITDQTVQYHGAADRYTTAGATPVATLYSNANTATTNAAVTIRAVGTAGGQAAAFAYDLPRSVALQRQGNPAWAAQERDGQAPIRSDDLYFGGASTDWVNLAKVAIPQADEQMRLLTNLIESGASKQLPLPRFWYFPNNFKAVVVMTGDDHGNNGTAGRFDELLANSPAGCDLTKWQCPRMTSYIYPGTPLTDSAARNYVSQGFEIGVHETTGCVNYTPTSLEGDYSSDLASWAANFPSLPAPMTNRMHCIVWSDWSSEPTVELRHGIRLDTNYYYWPASWITDRPGFMTGSGMPMRFTDATGKMIDVYQAPTQMTDESGQTYPATANALLDNALGPLGYYGAFVANMHTDQATEPDSDALIASAQSRGVPIVSAKQMLTWIDGRNASRFSGISTSGNSLTFTVAPGAGTDGLQAMLPMNGLGGTLTGLTKSGAAVSFTRSTIKGIDYAVFAGVSGTYTATYGAVLVGQSAGAAVLVTAPPTASSRLAAATPAPPAAQTLPNGAATVTWRTTTAGPSALTYRLVGGADMTVSGSDRTTAHRVVLTHLQPDSTYEVAVTGAAAIRLVTPAAGVAESTAQQFRRGAISGALKVTSVDDGELTLRGPQAGNFVSGVLDTGVMAVWDRASWKADVPPGARVAVRVRTGNAPRPDSSWSTWASLDAPGARVTANSRYLQYAVQLVPGAGGRAPTVSSVSFTVSGQPPVSAESELRSGPEGTQPAIPSGPGAPGRPGRAPTGVPAALDPSLSPNPRRAR